MPDPQVLSIAVSGETACVGTPVGVAVFEGGTFSGVIAPTAFATALLASEQNLIVGIEDQGVLAVPLAERTRDAAQPEAVETEDAVEQVLRIGDDVFVLTKSSLYRMNPRGLGWEPVAWRTRMRAC
jgi:hypothetical protein